LKEIIQDIIAVWCLYRRCSIPFLGCKKYSHCLQNTTFSYKMCRKMPV